MIFFAAHGMHVFLGVVLRLAHWLVLSFALLLVARALIDWAILYRIQLRERLLPLQNILTALTDPVLEPCRRVLRPRNPDTPDPTIFIAILICGIVDFLIAVLSSRVGSQN